MIGRTSYTAFIWQLQLMSLVDVALALMLLMETNLIN